jgi:cytochrome c heme-lyase
MGWWKADPPPYEEISPAQTPAAPSQALPRPAQEPSACPIDPKTREIWLQKAKGNPKMAAALPQSHKLQATPAPSAPNPSPSSTLAAAPAEECSSDRIDQSLKPTRSEITSPATRKMSHERVISSIPRGSSGNSPYPANAQNDAPTSASGNWIYPSESQFFEAVMRKQSASPEDVASSVSSIIPIHNAVNERAWAVIKAWEGNSSQACGGPKLLSFKGLGAGALSPKAKFNGMMGYTSPFDRHDWVVERCNGEKVEYIIDFYKGKEEPGKQTLNFHLDVRPKLNSIEGWKMRAERMLGTR